MANLSVANVLARILSGKLSEGNEISSANSRKAITIMSELSMRCANLGKILSRLITSHCAKQIQNVRYGTSLWDIARCQSASVKAAMNANS